jgi:phage-related protein
VEEQQLFLSQRMLLRCRECKQKHLLEMKKAATTDVRVALNKAQQVYDEDNEAYVPATKTNNEEEEG